MNPFRALPVLAAFPVLAALALPACKPAPPPGAEPEAKATASAPSAAGSSSASHTAAQHAAMQHALPPSADAALTDASLYGLDAAWTDQNGRPTALRVFRGHPVLIAMVFTSCGYACPMTVQDMKVIAQKLPDGGRGVRFVLVTLDPERDTPAALRAFARTHTLGAEWTLLRGGDDDVRMLAGLLGVRYREQADGDFAHSNFLTVLDAEGEVVWRQEGLGADPADTVAALEQALAGQP